MQNQSQQSATDGALITAANITDPDGFYEELINTQRDLDDEGSAMFQAKMLLLLANHVGDRQVLTEAMQIALKGLEQNASPD